MTAKSDAALSVEQVDRELFILLLGFDVVETEAAFKRILAGEFDSSMKMQAIARHRLAALAPAGGDYVLVPREPTLEMVNAGDKWWHPAEMWPAMLAAAPPPPTSEPTGEVTDEQHRGGVFKPGCLDCEAYERNDAIRAGLDGEGDVR